MSTFGSLDSIFNQINKVLNPILKSQGIQTLGTVTILGKQDEDERKPYPEFNPFRGFVINEFLRRKNQYPMMPSTPFVRMTSCNTDKDSKYQFFSLGLHGYDAKEQNIFDLTYASDTNDVVGTAISMGSKNRRMVRSNEIKALSGGEDAYAQYIKSIPADARPVPGITSVSIRRYGNGEPIKVSVQWVCYNRAQLEFLRNHFLIPGTYIVLEIGQNFSNQQIKKTFDFTRGDSTFDELATIVGAKTAGQASMYGRAKVVKDYVQPNNGNYDMFVGQIGNFEIGYDPETTTYTCTTTLLSQGEYLWGLKMSQTSVSLENHKPNEVSSIEDYFRLGLYDAFLNKQLSLTKDGKNTGIMKEVNYIQTSPELQKAAEANNVSVNANDYIFLSWKKVFTELFGDMVAVIKDNGIRAQLQHFLFNDGLGLHEMAGYHDKLISCEPESLVLINSNPDAYQQESDKSTKQIEDALKAYSGNGKFGPEVDKEPYKAALQTGVWINSGMIRECFMSATTLRDAIDSMLACLNRATADYWKLQLFYDENSGGYQIIDYKGTSQSRSEIFYKFNVGPGVKSITGDITHGGECLSVEFESAFPPELMAQMMAFARANDDQSADKVAFIKTLPLLGSTSAHPFVLNWSTMKDGLADYIVRLRNNKATDDTTGKMTAGSSDAASRQLEGGPGPAAVDATRKEAEKVGTASPTPLVQSDTDPLKTDTNPVPDPYKLERAPVNGTMTINSGFGKRINPVTQIAGESHNGVDIKVDSGTPVYNTNPGIAYRVETNHPGYGGVVYIRHIGSDGYESIYAHLSQIKVSKGDLIHNNTVIGLSGGALTDPGHGMSTGAHLHFEMRKDGTPYNQVLRSLDKVGTLKAGNPEAQVSIASINSIPGVDAKSDTPNTATPENPTGETEAEIAVKASNLRRAEVISKFGANVWALTMLNRTDMVNRIALDGYDNITKPNSFVSPYPTTTSVTVEVLGIAGISITDGFFVDRIPYTFEEHGVFQVTEVNDEVTSAGWKTKVRGYFKMLWYDADGQSTAIF